MTPDQEALLRKASESLRAAKLLFADGLYDFAASRAYYTMFYVAQAFLRNKGLLFSKHSAVTAAFGRHFAKTGVIPAEFHRYLIDGEDKRLVGDYDIGCRITQQQAAEQIACGEQFIALAENRIGLLPPSPAQP